MWLENEGKVNFNSNTYFSEITTPLQTIYQKLAENISFISKEDTVLKNKERILNNFITVEEQSDKLFELLELMLVSANKE